MPVASKISGAILDHDGVISDTEDLHCEVRRSVVLRRFNIEIDPAFYRQHMMSRGPDTQFSYFGVSSEYAKDLYAECQTEYGKLIGAGALKPVSGINELIKRAHARSLRLAIATTQPLAIVERCIGITLDAEARRLIEVKHSVHGIEGKKNKPFPDVYLDTAGMLGLDPQNCIAIEDSVTGVQSAVAAGVGRVIGRANPFTSAELLRNAGAHKVVIDYNEIMF